MVDVPISVKPARVPSLILAARILTLVYGAVLVILAVIPRIEGQGFGPPDWVLHAVAYGIFGGLILVSGVGRFGFFQGGMAAVGGAAAFGLLTEFLQFLIPYRSFEVLDFVADTVGAMIVVLFVLISFKVFGGRRWART